MMLFRSVLFLHLVDFCLVFQEDFLDVKVPAVFLMATYGEGDPPDRCDCVYLTEFECCLSLLESVSVVLHMSFILILFWCSAFDFQKWLLSLEAASAPFANLSFAVFGLGTIFKRICISPKRDFWSLII